jgi:hypothetical protein
MCGKILHVSVPLRGRVCLDLRKTSVREGASWVRKQHIGYDPAFNVVIVYSCTVMIFIATKYQNFPRNSFVVFF